MHRVRKRCKNLLLVTKTMSNPSPCLPLNMWTAAWLLGEPWGQWDPDTGLCPSCASCQLLMPCCSLGRVALTHPQWPWQSLLGDSAPVITCEMVMESTVWLHLSFLGFVGREELHSLHWAINVTAQVRQVIQLWGPDGFIISVSPSGFFTWSGWFPDWSWLPSWPIWVNSPLRDGKKLKGSAGNQYMEFSRQLLDSFPYVTCTIWVFPDKAQHHGIWENYTLEVISGSP